MAKWISRRSKRYNVDGSDFELEDESEVEIDDSRPLELCTVDEAVEKIGFGFFQFIAMSFSGIVWMVEAFEILLLTMLSAVLKCEWGLTEVEEATLTSVVFVGFFFGSIFWGFYADMYGRKWGLFFAAVLTSCFGILCAFSPSYEAMAFLRTMLGFAAAGSKQGITLSGEYCPAKYLRISTQLVEIYWVVGAVGIVGIGWATVPTLGWRWLLGFAAIPVIIMTFVIPFMPSSPRHLVIQGKKEQALKNLNIIARFNCKPKLHVRLVTDQEKEELTMKHNSSSKLLPLQGSKTEDEGGTKSEGSELKEENDVTQAFTEVEFHESHPLKKKKTEVQFLRVLDLFKNGMWKTTILLWMIWLNIVAYYFGIILLTTALFQYDKHCKGLLRSNCFGDEDPDFCRSLGDDDYRDLLWTSVAEVPGIFFTMFLMAMPCLGRKVVIASEMALLTVSTGFLLICVDRIVLTIILFICRGLIAGIFQAVYVYTPEVYSTTVRGLGLGLSSTFGRIGGVIIPYVAQPLLKANEFAAIGVFAGLAGLGVLLVAILPIETKGRSMKDTNS
jgi:MFS family permease